MLVALKDVPVQQNINIDEGVEFFSSPTTIEHILASIPQDYVQKALTDTNKHSRRERLLPGLAMMHFNCRQINILSVGI